MTKYYGLTNGFHKVSRYKWKSYDAMTSQSVARFAYILICDMYALLLLLSVLHVCLCFICLLMLNVYFFMLQCMNTCQNAPTFLLPKHHI